MSFHSVISGFMPLWLDGEIQILKDAMMNTETHIAFLPNGQHTGFSNPHKSSREHWPGLQLPSALASRAIVRGSWELTFNNTETSSPALQQPERKAGFPIPVL